MVATRAVHGGLAPTALFLRAFGQMLIVGFVPLQLARAGDHHYITLGMIYGLPFLMQFLAAPLWGRLVDRLGSAGPLAAVGLLGYAAMEGGAALAGNPAGILAALALGGAIGAALSPAARWHALRAADGEHRPLALALRGEAAGWLAGALLPAAFAAVGLDIFRLLGVAAVATALAAPLFWRTPAPIGRHRPARGSARDGGRRGLSLGFWLLLAGVFLQFMIGETFYSFYGVYLTQYLAGPLWLYSATLAATTALGFLFYGLAARATHRIGAALLLLATSAVYLLSFSLLAAQPRIWTAALVFSVPAFSFLRTAGTIGLAQAASGQNGVAMGFLDAAEGLAATVGGPLAGLFVARWSLAVLPVLPMVLSAMSSLPLLLVRRPGLRAMRGAEAAPGQ